MEKRKILIFSLAYFPFVGGAEVAVKEITDRLAEYDFDLITLNFNGLEKGQERVGNVFVRRIGRGPSGKYFFPWLAAALAKKLHQQKSYDACWAIMANQAGMAAAIFKRYFPTVPFILTLQEGDDLNSLAYRARLILPRFLGVFWLVDQITAISNYLARWEEKMGARGPISVIPNGVDLGRFQVLGDRDQKKIEKIIITTSRLVKKNGVDTLIEAMRFLPASPNQGGSDNIRLQILGIGPEEEKLKLEVRNLKLEDRVEFLGDVKPSEVPSYLAAADVFVRASRSEGLGNSFLEAMAAGLPVVGTPVGGILDFLHDTKCQGETLPNGKVSPLGQQTGWFCEVDNPKSVAEKVKYILNPTNRDKAEQVIANAKKLVQEKYDWNKIAKQMAEVFQKALI